MKNVLQYHAHVYFTASQRQQAEDLKADIASNFLGSVGKTHDEPIGPHRKAMFQVVFSAVEFGQIVPWLMFKRRGLSVLIHPDTDEHLLDHTERALWLGQPMPINTEALR